MERRISPNVRRRRWPIEVYDKAAELARDQDSTAESIADALAKSFTESPAAATIRDWLRTGKIKRLDPSETWTLNLEGDPIETALVLQVLSEVIARTEGRLAALSSEEAAATAHMLQVAPDLPPWTAFRLVREYLDGNVPLVQEYLAWTPWRDGGTRYCAAVTEGWIRPRAMFVDEYSRQAALALAMSLAPDSLKQEMRAAIEKLPAADKVVVARPGQTTEEKRR